MVGRFLVYPVGKNKDKSKSGKNCYTFLNGLRQKDSPNQLLDKCTSFTWWTDEDHDFKFMQPVNAVCDVSGDFVTVLEVEECK